jgi:hypothetical protein
VSLAVVGKPRFIAIAVRGSLTEQRSLRKERTAMTNDAHGNTGSLPAPSGPHLVGRTAIDLVDSTREDPFARRSGRPRSLTVWTWYPASDCGDGARTRYLPGLWWTNTAVFGFKAGRIRPHSHDGATPAVPHGDGFPLVVFSPGGCNSPLVYAALCEELASHGYVVAGVCHPHQILPLGIAASGKPHLFRSASTGGALQQPGARPFATDLAERGAVVQVDADDLGFVAHELLGSDRAPWNRCDPTSWSAIGHSFGGGSAVRACDPAHGAVAAISLDGGLWQAPATITTDRPVLQLFGEHPEYTESITEALAAKRYANEEYAHADRATTVGEWEALHRSARPGYAAVVTGATHTSFSDWPMLPSTFWSIGARALRGVSGPHVFDASSRAILAFLDRHVRGAGSDVNAVLASDGALRVGSPADLFNGEVHRVPAATGVGRHG